MHWSYYCDSSFLVTVNTMLLFPYCLMESVKLGDKKHIGKLSAIIGNLII